MLQVVEGAVAVDDVESSAGINRVFEVKVSHLDRGKAPAQDSKILVPSLGRDNGTSAIKKETGVIANAGSDLEDGGTGNGEVKAGEVLLATLIVAQVGVGTKLHFGRSAGRTIQTDAIEEAIADGAKRTRDNVHYFDRQYMHCTG
jgi:hypothetical protein